MVTHLGLDRMQMRNMSHNWQEMDQKSDLKFCCVTKQLVNWCTVTLSQLLGGCCLCELLENVVHHCIQISALTSLHSSVRRLLQHASDFHYLSLRIFTIMPGSICSV